MAWRFFPILPGQMGVSRQFRIGVFDAPMQRISWVDMPEPDPARLSGTLLYLDEVHTAAQPSVKETFARIERVAELKRMRGPLTIETYGLDLLDGAKREVLDRSPPPELQ
jgi:hypothetical protein